MPSNEPERLQCGKRFHKQVQHEWQEEAEGEIDIEHGIVKPSGRKGRVDVLAEPDDELCAVVEVKGSDWDRMSDVALRRNVRRQIKQVWDYIEAKLADEKTVSPGIVFPQRPSSQDRMELIEQLFEQEGIPVAWQDETIEERRSRAESE